jgi:hypothetical protein
LRDDSLSQIGVAAVLKRLVATTRKAISLFGAVALEREYLEQAFSGLLALALANLRGDRSWRDASTRQSAPSAKSVKNALAAGRRTATHPQGGYASPMQTVERGGEQRIG